MLTDFKIQAFEGSGNKRTQTGIQRKKTQPTTLVFGIDRPPMWITKFSFLQLQSDIMSYQAMPWWRYKPIIFMVNFSKS